MHFPLPPAQTSLYWGTGTVSDKLSKSSVEDMQMLEKLDLNIWRLHRAGEKALTG